ncbi:MAG: tRNA (adenosine(37)-N6)-threonylcarbamoyltransferase complex dimerization subunit type 1 TsaB [Rhizobiaceae bacterium]
MLLAIDTSGPFCSAAIADGTKVISSQSEELGRGHAERLMPLLEELLDQALVEWTDVTKVACTTGPGSFTGLRVGLATARGLALALNCPCVGVSVFEAMATNQPMPLGVVMDAKRDQLWLQTFNKDGDAFGKPLATPIADALSHIPPTVFHLAGSGASILASQDKRFKLINEFASPPIEGVLRCASSDNSILDKPKPLYLRAPDAKPQQPAILKS